MTQIDRRRFLGAAGAGAAALGAPSQNRIRVGIIGIQHSHLTAKVEAMYSNPNYEVVAVSEPDESTRGARGRLPLLQRLRWTSIDEMLADKTLDLIVFEGEVKDAVPFGTRVLEAGKHLHLEKPPINKMEPFRELVDLARRRDHKLQLGYIWRFHEGVEAALEAYRKGWLGEVFMIRATINSDRDMKQRAVEGRYRGGSMFELGGHMSDRVISFLGKPTRVRPWLRHDTGIQDAVMD